MMIVAAIAFRVGFIPGKRKTAESANDGHIEAKIIPPTGIIGLVYSYPFIEKVSDY